MPPPPPPPGRGPSGPPGPPPPGGGPAAHGKPPPREATVAEKAEAAELTAKADAALAQGDLAPPPSDLATSSDADLAALSASAEAAGGCLAEAAKLYAAAAKLDPSIADRVAPLKKKARAAERQVRDAEDALQAELGRRAEIKQWAVPDNYSIQRCISIETATGQLAAEEAAAITGRLASSGALVAYFAARPEVKVVVIDFFAYSCTNCLRTIPGLVALHAKYAEHGLGVIAYHRPEFDFETEAVNLERFVVRKLSSFSSPEPVLVKLSVRVSKLKTEAVCCCTTWCRRSARSLTSSGWTTRTQRGRHGTWHPGRPTVRSP